MHGRLVSSDTQILSSRKQQLRFLFKKERDDVLREGREHVGDQVVLGFGGDGLVGKGPRKSVIGNA